MCENLCPRAAGCTTASARTPGGVSSDEFVEMFPSVDREDAAEFLRLVVCAP